MRKRLEKYSAILFTFVLIALQQCGPEIPPPPPPPYIMTIYPTSNGRGVIITWNEVPDVDGFDLITPDKDTILLDYNETSYIDSFPMATGTYFLYIVTDDERYQKSSVSSSPQVSSSNFTLHVWSHNEPCGFGWNTATGIGTVYDCIPSNTSLIDFYLNDNTSSFDFTSSDEPPYSGEKISYIRNMGTLNFFETPTTGYINSEEVIVGNYYAFHLQGDYYGKIYVVSVTNGESVTFCCWFQTIQTLRIF